MEKIIGSKWTVGQYTPSENFKKITNHSCVCCAETLEVIALCGPADDLASQKQADLMAAAPEMLHELESIICDLNRCIDGKYTLSENEMMIYVNAFSRVCEKARGEE